MRLTHPDKLLWPEAGVSKGMLLAHYEHAWERMAPFALDRPLTLVRSPDGRKRFFQQHAFAGMPDAIHTLRDPVDGAELLFIRDFEGLAALVQFGTVEIHGWGAKADALDRPDQITFDLDPDEGMDAQAVREAALAVREQLSARGMASFVKTSGGKGFHITVPLAPRSDWKTVERFASGLAHGLAAEEAERFTAGSAKTERAGRIFVDYLRNNPNATTVLPWSSRARAGATVSVPIPWEALEGRGVEAQAFKLGGAALEKALSEPDAWKEFRAQAFDGTL